MTPQVRNWERDCRRPRAGCPFIVDDAGAEYPITIDPFIEKNYLAGSADDAREEFGVSVSISGDTVAVGAPDVGWSSIHGAVYLFTVSEGEQTSADEAIVLTSPRSGSGDAFGGSVSISGDTIVVGAPWERDLELHDWYRVGATYVFEKPSGGWVSTSDASRLTPPDVLSEDIFWDIGGDQRGHGGCGNAKRFRVCVQQADRWVGGYLGRV